MSGESNSKRTKIVLNSGRELVISSGGISWRSGRSLLNHVSIVAHFLAEQPENHNTPQYSSLDSEMRCARSFPSYSAYS